MHADADESIGFEVALPAPCVAFVLVWFSFVLSAFRVSSIHSPFRLAFPAPCIHLRFPGSMHSPTLFFRDTCVFFRAFTYAFPSQSPPAPSRLSVNFVQVQVQVQLRAGSGSGSTSCNFGLSSSRFTPFRFRSFPFAFVRQVPPSRKCSNARWKLAEVVTNAKL